jgi:phosphosulfolactate phosphohydrolase-like enzyme
MEQSGAIDSIRQLVAADLQGEGFSREDFSSSGALIDIIRDKSSKENLIQKSEELIQKENEAEEIVEDVTTSFGEGF